MFIHSLLTMDNWSTTIKTATTTTDTSINVLMPLGGYPSTLIYNNFLSRKFFIFVESGSTLFGGTVDVINPDGTGGLDIGLDGEEIGAVFPVGATVTCRPSAFAMNTIFNNLENIGREVLVDAFCLGTFASGTVTIPLAHDQGGGLQISSYQRLLQVTASGVILDIESINPNGPGPADPYTVGVWAGNTLKRVIYINRTSTSVAWPTIKLDGVTITPNGSPSSTSLKQMLRIETFLDGIEYDQFSEVTWVNGF